MISIKISKKREKAHVGKSTTKMLLIIFSLVCIAHTCAHWGKKMVLHKRSFSFALGQLSNSTEWISNDSRRRHYLISNLSCSVKSIIFWVYFRPHKKLLFPVLWRLKKLCVRAIFIFIFHLFYKVKMRFLRKESFYIFQISCEMYFYPRSRS